MTDQTPPRGADVRTPCFSVVIPTYNRAEALTRCVRSVLEQASVDLEVIVVDDGSTDATADALAAIDDDRLHVVVQSNQGASRARNAGLRQSSGRFVAFLDSDDEARPNWLAELSARLEDEHAGLVCCGVDLVDDVTGAVAARRPSATHAVREPTLFRAGSFAAPRDALLDVGGYLDGLAYAENTELGIRLTAWCRARGLAIRSIPDTMVIVHRSLSGGSAPRRRESVLRVLDEHAATFATDPERLGRWLSIAGVDAARAGDLRLARSLFARAVRARPWHVRAWARMATACLPAVARRVWRPI